jgi:hypothetical protein
MVDQRSNDRRIASGALAVRWRAVWCMRCWAANPEEIEAHGTTAKAIVSAVALLLRPV